MKLSTKRIEELKKVYRAICADDSYWMGGATHIKAHRIAGKIATKLLPLGVKI